MRILFFGDSITDAGRKRRRSVVDLSKYGYGYVNNVVQQLSDSPEGYEFINRGISGNRVVDLYKRIERDCWNYSPDVLSILVGVNDVWLELIRKRGVKLDRFEQVYRTMLKETKERFPNIKLIILEPFMLKGKATEKKFDEFSELYKYAAVVKRIAEEFGAKFIPLQDKFDKAAEKFGAQNCLYDGVHPNAIGAKLIANAWIKAFKEINE